MDEAHCDALRECGEVEMMVVREKGAVRAVSSYHCSPARLDQAKMDEAVPFCVRKARNSAAALEKGVLTCT